VVLLVLCSVGCEVPLGMRGSGGGCGAAGVVFSWQRGPTRYMVVVLLVVLLVPLGMCESDTASRVWLMLVPAGVVFSWQRGPTRYAW